MYCRKLNNLGANRFCVCVLNSVARSFKYKSRNITCAVLVKGREVPGMVMLPALLTSRGFVSFQCVERAFFAISSVSECLHGITTNF